MPVRAWVQGSRFRFWVLGLHPGTYFRGGCFIRRWGVGADHLPQKEPLYMGFHPLELGPHFGGSVWGSTELWKHAYSYSQVLDREPPKDLRRPVYKATDDNVAARGARLREFLLGHTCSC